MNRNTTILIIVLTVVVLAGYLVWLKNRFQAAETAAVITPTPRITQTVPSLIPTIATATASISARPSKTATPSGTKATLSPKLSPTKTKQATTSSQVTR